MQRGGLPLPPSLPLPLSLPPSLLNPLHPMSMHSTAQHSTAQHGTARHGVARAPHHITCPGTATRMRYRHNTRLSCAWHQLHSRGTNTCQHTTHTARTCQHNTQHNTRAHTGQRCVPGGGRRGTSRPAPGAAHPASPGRPLWRPRWTCRPGGSAPPPALAAPGPGHTGARGPGVEGVQAGGPCSPQRCKMHPCACGCEYWGSGGVGVLGWGTGSPGSRG